MPIVVSDQGWVRVAPKRTKPSKPVNPVDLFRGPLAYITGRPEFAEPVKKPSIKQFLIEPPPPPPVPRSHHRERTSSAPVPVKSRSKKPPTELFEEADEEIVRPEIDTQSRRSASPAASRHSRAAPSVRSSGRLHISSASVYEHERRDRDDTEGRRPHAHKSSSRRPHSVYSDDYYDDYKHYHRERSYRERDRYSRYPHPHPHLYPPAPAVQPIVIYPQQSTSGCGGHHSCSGHNAHGYTQPHPQMMIPSTPFVMAASREPAGLPAPRPPPSETSSSSKSSGRPMSYKWYAATKPLEM